MPIEGSEGEGTAGCVFPGCRYVVLWDVCVGVVVDWWRWGIEVYSRTVLLTVEGNSVLRVLEL